MDQNAAEQILQQVILASGVLTGLLAVFLGIIPQRKRNKIDSFHSAFYRLEQRKIDIEFLEEDKRLSYLEKIAIQQAVINEMIKNLRKSIVVGGIPINMLSYGLLIYLVGIFVISISYFCIVIILQQVNENIIYGSVAAICMGFCFLIPVTYWTAVKEYDLK